MEIKMGHIEVFVKDPMASKEFYCSVLGFELDTIQQDKFVWLRAGDYTILLRPAAESEAANNSRGAEYSSAEKGFVLYTNDLESARKDLENKGLVFKGTDGSERCLTFTDPDGNWFQLVNPAEH